MLSISPSSKIYLCREPVCLRKSFDGLAALVATQFNRRPDDGSYFVFLSKGRKLVKILLWEGDGYSIWAKRLERGQFNPRPALDGSFVITPCELRFLLDGVKSAKLYKRYGRH